jgi:hypothetical protein
MTEGVRGHRDLRVVVELLLEEVEAQLEVFNYVVVVGATLVVLDVTPAQDLPVFCF